MTGLPDHLSNIFLPNTLRSKAFPAPNTQCLVSTRSMLNLEKISYFHFPFIIGLVLWKVSETQVKLAETEKEIYCLSELKTPKAGLSESRNSSRVNRTSVLPFSCVSPVCLYCWGSTWWQGDPASSQQFQACIISIASDTSKKKSFLSQFF